MLQHVQDEHLRGTEAVPCLGLLVERPQVAAAISGGVLLLVSLVVGFARRKLRQAAETEGDVDDFLLDVVRRTSIALLVLPAVYAGSRALALPEETSSLLRTVTRCRSSRRPRSGPPRWSTFSCDAIAGGDVLSADYNVYMDVQQAINLAVVDAFEKEGIEFAYPTRTLHLQRPAQAAGFGPPPLRPRSAG